MRYENKINKRNAFNFSFSLSSINALLCTPYNSSLYLSFTLSSYIVSDPICIAIIEFWNTIDSYVVFKHISLLLIWLLSGFFLSLFFYRYSDLFFSFYQSRERERKKNRPWKTIYLKHIDRTNDFWCLRLLLLHQLHLLVVRRNKAIEKHNYAEYELEL